MTTSKVLVLGDGVVAAELADAWRNNGLTVDGYLFDGPIPDWKQEPFELLNAQLASLDLPSYEAVVLAFSSEKAVVRHIARDLENQVSGNTLFLVSAMYCAATETASWLERSERVIGFGYVPPFAGVKCAELSKPLQGLSQYAEQAAGLFASLGVETAYVGDSAGLVMPRLVSALINEAVTALMEGVASANDLDTAMKLGVNYPHGPLEWADRIGLDQVYATLRGVYEEQGEDRYRPAPLLRRMVLAGLYGRRSGYGGFYEYETENEVTEHA